MTHDYHSAAAFKQALERRLRTASTSGVDFARRRQLVVFGRFLALIATAGPVQARRLRAAIEQTFAFRGTHEVPARLPAPAENWAAPYAAIAKEDELRWTTLADAFAAARAFLDPVLAGPGDVEWEPTTWAWAPAAPSPDTERD